MQIAPQFPWSAAYRLPPLRLGLVGLSMGASGHLAGCLTPQLFRRPRQHPSHPNPAPQVRDFSISPEPRPGGPTVWSWAGLNPCPLPLHEHILYYSILSSHLCRFHRFPNVARSQYFQSAVEHGITAPTCRNSYTCMCHVCMYVCKLYISGLYIYT